MGGAYAMHAENMLGSIEVGNGEVVYTRPVSERS
jgi:hypothetical protein